MRILLILALFMVWWSAAVLLSRKFRLKREGPILLLPLARGRLDRAFRRPLLAKVLSATRHLVFPVGVVGFALLAYEAYLSLSRGLSVGVREVLALPGINPYIPVFLGIFSLAIAISVHELSHGIVMEREGLGVSEVGLILVLLPLGAYVEPREKVEETHPLVAEKVFSAGPGSNLALAALAVSALLIMSAGIAPTANGLLITAVAKGSELDVQGVKPGVVVLSVDGRNPAEAIWGGLDPRVPHRVLVEDPGGVRRVVLVHGGIVVTDVVGGSPAQGAGLEPGDAILAVDGRPTPLPEDLRDALAPPGPHTIWLYRPSTGEHANVTVTPSGGKIGVYAMVFGLSGVETVDLASYYSPRHFLHFLALPFMGMEPAPSWARDWLTPPYGGWLAFNALYWVFWMNLALGLTNSLPLYPLDGGNILYNRLKRILGGGRRAEAISKRVVALVSVASFVLLIIPIVMGFIR